MSGYDPAKDGPWSDVDDRPWVPVPKKVETPEEREARLEERRKLDAEYLRMTMAEWDEREGDAADRDPEAYQLARQIRMRQPSWADGEECGVTTDIVRAALTPTKAEDVIVTAYVPPPPWSEAGDEQ